MNKLPFQELASPIGDAVAEVEAAKAKLQEVMSTTQANCEHRIVSEMPYRSGNYFGSTAAHRICNHCRLIEEGSHWSGGSTWSKHDHSRSDLGNEEGRIIIPVASDHFWKLRITA